MKQIISKAALSKMMSSKQFLIVLACSLLFICVAIYVYVIYIRPKFSKQYAANKEFTEDTDVSGENYADLYFFYTSWCPHCKTAFPIWNQLKQEMADNTINGTTIKFIEIDCDKETAVAEKFKVEGYPTIKLVNKNQIIEYDAKPDLDTLRLFLEKSL